MNRKRSELNTQWESKVFPAFFAKTTPHTASYPFLKQFSSCAFFAPTDLYNIHIFSQNLISFHSGVHTVHITAKKTNRWKQENETSKRGERKADKVIILLLTGCSISDEFSLIQVEIECTTALLPHLRQLPAHSDHNYLSSRYTFGVIKVRVLWKRVAYSQMTSIYRC